MVSNMDGYELGKMLMRAALDAERQAAVEAFLKYKGQPFKGTQKADMRVRAAVVAVLRELAKVAPGTPEYAVEFDFDGLADAVEVQP